MVGLVEFLKLSPHSVEAKHVTDFQFNGIHDEIWIPQIAADGYIVITADAGKGGTGKGEKLPRVCVVHKVTHLIFSTNVHRKKTFEKTTILIQVIDEIVKLACEPKGSRFQLRLTTAGNPTICKIESPLQSAVASGDSNDSEK